MSETSQGRSARCAVSKSSGSHSPGTIRHACQQATSARPACRFANFLLTCKQAQFPPKGPRQAFMPVS